MDKKSTATGKRRSVRLPIAVTYDEYASIILPHIKSRHHKVGVMLAFESGLRIAEVIALKPEHIDMERDRIEVKAGKGDKDRVTVLPKHWLPEHMKYIPIACSKRALQKAFEIACERSGLYKTKPSVHFHSLRHGFATFCYEQGMKVSQIQILLGHADISTTMIYVKVSPIHALDSCRKAWT